MPFSSGVFGRVYNWVTEQASSPIEIAKLDAQEEDIATALSNCILRDGTGKPTAAIDFNSQKITALADATAATDALNRQAADARYGRVIAKYKASTTSRSTTTTVSNDPDLIAALEANAVYAFDLMLRVSPDLGGLKVLINYSGSFTNASSFYAGAAYINSLFSGGITTDIGTNFIYGTAGGANDWYRVFGTIVTTATGNLSLQWAQGSSNAAAARVMAGSSMLITKIA